MKLHRLLFCSPALVALLLVPLTLSAASWPHDGSDLAPDPAATFGTLDNGLRYVVLPHDEPPGRLSLRLFVGAGSLQESERQRGLAHFLEHMAFNGTRGFSPGEMVEYFQRLGMAFGPDNNAHTWWRETVYKLELPDTDDAILKDSFSLLRDYADGMLLLEEEIESERGVILAEKRTRESPERMSWEHAINFLMPEARIPERVVIGTEEVIKNATREDFVDYYTSWYTPDRMVLIAVGDITEEHFLDFAQEAFASMEATEPKADPDMGKLTPRGLVADFYGNPELAVTSVNLDIAQELETTTDTFESRVDELHRDLASAILNRRLEKLSKKEGATFQDASAYHYDWLDFVRLAGISLETRPELWGAALLTLEQEYRRALTHGFTATELMEAVANRRNAMQTAVEQAPTRKSRELSDIIVRSVGDGFVYRHPIQDWEVMAPVLEAVTLEDVNAAFRQTWGGEDRFLHVSGAFEMKAPQETIVAVYQASEAVPVAPPVEEEVAAFAYTDFGQPGEVTSDQLVEDLAIRQVTFANNCAVHVKRTDFEAGKVRVAVRFGGGLLDLPAGANRSLALMAGATLVPGGLEAHSADELQAIFAGRDVGGSFAVEEDGFVLSGITTAEDLTDQLRLMAAYLVAPAFREEAFRLGREQLSELYRRLATTPQGTFANEVDHFLKGNDPRGGYPPLQDVLALGPEEIRAWMAPILAKSFLDVAIVGDVDPDAAIAAVQATFGALPERAAEKPTYAEARQIVFPRTVEAMDFPYQSEIPRALAVTIWPTEDTYDIHRTRRLSVMASILDDRMREKVREELGEAYSPYAYNMSSDTWEDFGMTMGVVIANPAQADMITQIVRDLGEEIASGGISDDEFERALKPMLTSIEEWRRNNVYWLNNVLVASREYPQRLEWARSMEDDIKSIQREEVEALARKYLPGEHAVRVTVTPVPLEPVAAGSEEESAEDAG